MKSHLKAIICQYFPKNLLSWLLLLSATPTLILSSTMASIAVPINMIAQVNNVGKINRPTLQIGSQGERVSELQAALQLLGFYTGVVDGIYQEGTARAVSQFKQAAGLNPNGVVDAITWEKLFPNISTVVTNNTTSGVQPTTSNSLTVPTQPSRNTRLNNTVVPKTTIPKPTTIPQNKPNTSFQPTPINQRNPNIQYTPAGWPILRLGNRGAEVIKLQKLLQNLGFLKGAIDGDFGVSTEAAVKAAQVRYGLQPDGVVGGATWEAFLRRLPQQR
ncbi:peptidoglycan-binding domain-containing protein [Anabaena sp. UHCC 0451]|uniref:peptidoglycan-binding domain-containing protein n=1 Tax=Anabaena sp. UHCC 0451 TaxID=2055235 RepID=UPI002B20210E|nr:peptidoglycan-binding domain-containing protein [Anabaena sp. UHCC 0451]MEA5576450.1 peptidoglycan-binding domain-containing protein [Anabaena sp. UHCC 0451]